MADNIPMDIKLMSKNMRPRAYMPDSARANKASHASRLNQLDFHCENAFSALSG